MITKSFVLTPGTNTITVVAYTRDNDVVSPPAVHTVHFAAAPAAVASPAMPLTQNTPVLSSQPALSMLVVGVNRYRDKALWLRYAVPDGQELVAAVRQAASPLVRDVKVTALFDEQATMAELEAAFARVAAQTNSNDIFMLYLAGHGTTLDGRYHFIPQDFHYANEDAVRHNAITQDHLQRWLASVPARKSILLIDTCESGSFSQSLAVMRGMIEKTAIDRLSRATGRATIVAATDAQPAMEGYEGHGVFTYAVLQGLRYADTVSGNRDGITGLFELAAYVHTRVPEITMQTFAYEQIPQVHMQGSDFPLAWCKPSIPSASRWLLTHQAGAAHSRHKFLPLVNRPVLKKHHPGVGPRARLALVDDFRLHINGVPVEHGLGEVDLVKPEIGNRRAQRCICH